MAKTIAFTAKLTLTEDVVTLSNASSTKTQTRESTLTAIHQTLQNVGTAREAVSLVDINITNATGAEYVVLLFNRDATNFVTVEQQTGAATYAIIGKMLPGEPYGAHRRPKLDVSGYGGLFLTANTAACNVEVVASSAGNPLA